MSKYSYKIATLAEGVEGLTNVETLGTCDKHVAPRGLDEFEAFGVYRTSASGLEYGDGYPHTVWHFDAIQEPQLTALLAYLGAETNQSAQVYITTRIADRTYKNYRAVMHRPKASEREPGNRTKYTVWHNVDVRFTMLEAQ